MMEKKTAMVTGGSRGIGYAISARLAREGYNIAILATSAQESCQAALDELGALGAPDSVLYVRGGVQDAGDRDRFLAQTLQRFGAVHVLVNNAGVAPLERADILEMTEASWERVLGVNLRGAMFLTQAVARQMLRQPLEGAKRGTIINISSCSAEVVSTARAEYCVSKAGLSMLTKLFAKRLAPEGVYVHEVRPGVIRTDMTEAVTQKYDALFAAGEFPIARWGAPEDVAAAVAAFAGDTYLYTTGNHIDVDGGFHIRSL